MLLDDLAIRTDKFRPRTVDGKQTTSLEPLGQRTYLNLKEQVVVLLSAIQIEEAECNAFEAAESFCLGEWKQDVQATLPKGTAIAIARRGHCEGNRVEIAIIDENDKHHTIVSIKYLIGRNRVWQIAQQIDHALTEGLFNY
jgi:hypothetical protein